MNALDLASVYLASYEPAPILTPDEWADRYRVLTRAETPRPGQWRTDAVPFAREPLQRLGSYSPTRRVVLKLPAQFVKTEAILNWIGYTVDVSPCPIMLCEPTIADAEKVSKQRVAHLAKVPRLAGKFSDPRSRDSGNTVQIKEFPNGILHMIGANSANGMSGTPIGRLACDEVDRWPESIGGEGDPFVIVFGRLGAWGDKGKALITSTPVWSNGRIEKAWAAGSQGTYQFACPHCGEYQAPTTSGLKWAGDHDESSKFEVWYECAACGKRIEETARQALLASAKYVHAHPERLDDCASYTVHGILAPMGGLGWKTLAREFIQAQADLKRGDARALQGFTNLREARGWEDRGEQVDEASVKKRAESDPPFDPQHLPERVRAVTMGVDVQDDRLECEVVAWAAGMESWSLGYYTIPSDPLDAETWRALTAIRRLTYATEDGRTLRAAVTCVDTGYRTQTVYDYARLHHRDGVRAIKGNDQRSKLIWEAKARKGGKNKEKGRFHLVAVNDAKDAIAAYLKITTPGPGYCHIPADRDPSWFEQLTAEHRKKTTSNGRDTWVWRKRAEHLRNEAIDCRVYALAALHAMLTAGVNLGAVQPATDAAPSDAEPTTVVKPIVAVTVDKPPASGESVTETVRPAKLKRRMLTAAEWWARNGGG